MLQAEDAVVLRAGSRRRHLVQKKRVSVGLQAEVVLVEGKAPIQGPAKCADNEAVAIYANGAGLLLILETST